MATDDATPAADPGSQQPVRFLPEEAAEEPTSGTALCLSGGGYRAMLFHLGALWRLNDAGWLARLDRVSSVSGGSIAAGALGLAWNRLEFAGGIATNLADQVIDPIRSLAGHTVDVGAVLTGALTPGTIAEHAARAYREYLFGDATLQDLPDSPRFIFNATSVQTGALFRFSKPYLADWRVGRVHNPTVQVADAVAASAAFPPVLSPVRLNLAKAPWVTEAGNDLAEGGYRERAVLTDGGVYDNLGLETAWKRCRTVLVSDAGGELVADPDPGDDWARHLFRVLKVIDGQVRDLRKRQCIDAYRRGERLGAYWGIRSDVGDYRLPDPLACPAEQTMALAELPTRLARLDHTVQERLINWGFAACDVAVRAHVDPGVSPPDGFPYPEAGVGKPA